MKKIIPVIFAAAMLFVSCNNKEMNQQTDPSKALVETILTRTSIRIYEDRPIEQGKIDTLLRAGMSAPTACDQRPWHFVVVDDREILEKIAQASPYSGMAASAPLAIVVCGNMEKAQGGCGAYWTQDVSAATENILLAAHAMGLGAVWCGIYPDTERAKALGSLLSLPSNMVAFNIIVIGYPAEHPTPKNKYTDDNVSYNHFGGTKADTVAYRAHKTDGEFRTFDVIDEYGENPFATFEQGWLLCAGNRESSNAMTIGWGAFGTLWRVPAVTVYVAQARYTRQFMDSHRYFTIMQFGPGYENVLQYMGTKSGRDGDKAKALGLHTLYTENGTPYYAEASVVIECETMFADKLSDAGQKELPRSFYANFDAGVHSMYIGKVVKAMKK